MREAGRVVRVATRIALACVTVSTTCACAPGDDDSSDTIEDATTGAELTSPATVEPSEITPEASGELEMNTLRIGNQVWERTRRAPSGRCAVSSGDGPDSVTVWGNADGDAEINLAISATADGGFGAQIDSAARGFYWAAGDRNEDIDDLAVAVDPDRGVVVGTGVFTNAFTGERAAGSFAFRCAPDEA